jgi:circadian clock protein KaiC
MTKTAIKQKTAPASLPKSATGIQGLDEVSGGGLPRGRPTLVCGSAGCGKTLLAMEFLVRGAMQYGEPGVFMAFEETAKDLTKNVRSLGFDLDNLTEQEHLVVDYVHVERSEIEETGEYDLEGLFIRLGHAIDSIGAKRIVLDTIETLFSGLSNTAILRAELRRLFRWIREKGVTAIVTAERGEGTLTRHGLEEYVSDCVSLLDHRVNMQISTRRLRILKYRGSTHGCNEYPFLIDENSISVLPITSLNLQHEASTERISSGISRLDAMLGGEGFFRGSSILVSGTTGTGKTSLAAQVAAASCQRNERCVYFAFEESASQLLPNLKTVGLNLEPWVKKELLRFHNARPVQHGTYPGRLAASPRDHERAITMKRDGQRHTDKATARALNRLIAGLDKPSFILRLYVVGLTPRSTQAVERIKAICERHLAGRYDLAVIDLYQKPYLARHAQVVAAPTLVKTSPLPERRIIGNMADERAVLRGLNVQAG